MGIKVAKFGGSSLANATQFERVRAIVKGDEDIRFVVPSAPGKRNNDDEKITDLLYKLQSLANKDGFNETYQKIEDRYFEIIKTLNIDLDLTADLEKVKNDILNGADADYAASRGEYLNGIILANYLDYEFIDAAEVICFDENGKLLFEETNETMAKRLNNSKNAVIPGFYGAQPCGRVKTLSRGGSDVTGALVAGAINAEVYQNWTDVSGFLVADPRIVDNPEVIKYITYKELRELSYMGATVLHEEAIFPVRRAGIPINVKNTNAPLDEGTLIVQAIPDDYESKPITGIAGRKGFTVIAIEKAMMNSEVGFGQSVLDVLARRGVSFEHMPTGIDTLSLVVSDAELSGKLDDIITDLNTVCNPDSIEIFKNLALIATVGQGMIRNIGISAKLFGALAKNNVNIRMIDQGSSELNIIVGVEIDDFEVAVCSIYNAFMKDGK